MRILKQGIAMWNDLIITRIFKDFRQGQNQKEMESGNERKKYS